MCYINLIFKNLTFIFIMKSYKIDCKCDVLSYINNYNNKCINHKLLNNLYSTKTFIDKIDINKWEKFKKLNNKYEYIYTSSNKNKNISNINPISRSYFKIHEIIKDFYINKFN